MAENPLMSRMQDEMTCPQSKIHAGIDVGKEQLDIFIQSEAKGFSVPNTKAGLRKLITRLNQQHVSLVALEATGRYHYLAHAMINNAGIPVAVINPYRSRQFSESLGQMAKTDKIDARILAQYAQRLNPKPSKPRSAEAQALRDLQVARRQIVDDLADLKRQLQTMDNALIRKQMKARIAMGERHRQELEKHIQTVINDTPQLKNRYEILISIPHIGKTTAALLLSDLTELGQANAREIAALAGVAPMNWDSDKKQGNRMIRGGRQVVRKALYMCAVSCVRRSNPLGQTYRNLIKRGKNPKVALTAVMRKLVVIANTLIAENRVWAETPPNLNTVHS